MTKFEWSLPKMFWSIIRFPAFLQRHWTSGDSSDRFVIAALAAAIMGLIAPLVLAIVLMTDGLALIIPMVLIVIFDLIRFVGHLQIMMSEREE